MPPNFATDTVDTIADLARSVAADALDVARAEIVIALDAMKKAASAEVERRGEAGRDFVAAEGRHLAARLQISARSDESLLHARLLETLSLGAMTLSNDLQRESLAALLARTEDFAERNPGAFIAAAAITGFAATRIVRASVAPMTNGDDVAG